MKKKSFLSGIGAKLALAAVALTTVVFTSCEKEEFNVSWIHRIITLLIWILLFLLGIDVGGNESIIKGLHTLGLEAIIITVAAVAGSTLCAWGLWYLLYKWNGGKETKA